MLKIYPIIAVIAIFWISSCTEAETIPSDEDVFMWARHNIETAFSQTDLIKPEFFEIANIPEDFDFKKTPADFNGIEPPIAIPEDNADFIRDVGIVSALADHCDLDWNERNFLPMMQWQRARLPNTDRNGYLIYRLGVSHGYAMGQTDFLLKHWKIDCDRFQTDIEGKFFTDIFPQF